MILRQIAYQTQLQFLRRGRQQYWRDQARVVSKNFVILWFRLTTTLSICHL